jgi:hypothetical protein
MSRKLILRVVLLLAVSAEICRSIAFRGSLDRMAVSPARLALALIDAENALDSLKPPFSVAEIGWRVQAKLQSTSQHRDDRFI